MKFCGILSLLLFLLLPLRFNCSSRPITLSFFSGIPPALTRPFSRTCYRRGHHVGVSPDGELDRAVGITSTNTPCITVIVAEFAPHPYSGAYETRTPSLLRTFSEFPGSYIQDLFRFPRKCSSVFIRRDRRKLHTCSRFIFSTKKGTHEEFLFSWSIRDSNS